MARFLNIHRSGVLKRWHGWRHMKCCRFGASSVYTSQPCTRSQCHFIQSHIGRVYAYLAVTCHLHFWQNDQDLLCATAVTRGWNGYRNKSQHRKSIMEKKILPPLQQGFKPTTFQSQVRRSNHWAIPDIYIYEFGELWKHQNNPACTKIKSVGLHIWKRIQPWI